MRHDTVSFFLNYYFTSTRRTRQIKVARGRMCISHYIQSMDFTLNLHLFCSNNTVTYQILNINMSEDWIEFQLDPLGTKE